MLNTCFCIYWLLYRILNSAGYLHLKLSTSSFKRTLWYRITGMKYMMRTGIIIGSKRIVVFSCSVRPAKSILMIFISKVFLTTKHFWKTIKPFFSNKGLNTNNIMLIEKNELVYKEEIIANIINNYFTNIITYLKLKHTKIDPKANLESIINTW